MIEGLSHVTFVVRDLDRMAQFLIHLFDAEEVYSSGDTTFSIAREKFFVIGGVWVAIMEGEEVLEKSYNHVAFKIRDEDFDGYHQRARELGLEMRLGRPRVAGEGRSLYVYDHDNHLFELHTGTLQQRLERYNR